MRVRPALDVSGDRREALEWLCPSPGDPSPPKHSTP